VDQLRPHPHQGVPGAQHYQILAHFPTAVPYRVQRLRIDPPQSGQLVRIDAITLALATLRPFQGVQEKLCLEISQQQALWEL